MRLLLLAAFVILMPFVAAFAESDFDVIIPRGAGNPSYDPQFKKDLFAEEWYIPTSSPYP